MPTKYYEVELEFKEIGKGQAEIIVPELLQDKEWRYLQLHEGDQKAIVQIEADADEQKSITANKAFRPLTDKHLNSLKKSYPTPRLKQKYRTIEIQTGVGPEASEGDRPIETVQQVRWKFYVIDVPIQT